MVSALPRTGPNQMQCSGQSRGTCVCGKCECATFQVSINKGPRKGIVLHICVCVCLLDGDGEHYMGMGCGYGENI